jgi:hypothetical protein
MEKNILKQELTTGKLLEAAGWKMLFVENIGQKMIQWV